MSDSRKRALLLCRQSLTRSDSVSIPSQEDALRRYAAERDMTVVGVLSAESTRGWWEIAQRDEVQQALALAEQRAYDALLVWSIDRLGRNVRIVETIAHELDRHGVTLLSLSEPGIGDPFIRQLMAALGEKFTRDLSERLKIAVKERVTRGRFQGRPPLGYRSEVVTIEGQPAKRLVIDEDGRQLVERLYALWLDDGLTVAEIVEMLTREGVPTRNGGAWSYVQVAHILRNPIYIGQVRHRGELHAGVHPPLMDEERWQAAQARFITAPHVRRKPLTSWCEGAILHTCGARMYLTGEAFPASAPGGRAKGPYGYFRCRRRDRPLMPCDGRRIRAERVEQAALVCLATDLGAVVSVEEAIRHSADAALDQQAARQRAALDRREAAVERRHARARERWLAGREPLEWMDDEDHRRDDELAAIAAERAALPAVPDRSALVAAQRMLQEIGQNVRHASDAGRAALLQRLGVLIVGETVTIRYHPPYADLIPCPAVVPLPRSPSRTRRRVGEL